MASTSICLIEGEGSKPSSVAIRTCCVCDLDLSIDNFSKVDSKKSKSKINSRCRDCQRQYSKEHYNRNKEEYFKQNKTYRAKIKEWIDSLKSGPCTDCGIKYPPYVMDFDHKEDKSFNISRAHNHCKESMLIELAKCDLVCSNCHRERTFGILKRVPQVGL